MKAILLNCIRLRVFGQERPMRRCRASEAHQKPGPARTRSSAGRLPIVITHQSGSQPRNKMIRDTERFLADPRSKPWALAACEQAQAEREPSATVEWRVSA